MKLRLWACRIKLHNATSELGVALESGLGLENLTVTKITRCIRRKLQVHAIGPSDHSDWLSIHRLSNKKGYTEIVDRFPTDILLSKIMNKFVTSINLAVIISLANT